MADDERKGVRRYVGPNYLVQSGIFGCIWSPSARWVGRLGKGSHVGAGGGLLLLPLFAEKKLEGRDSELEQIPS